MPRGGVAEQTYERINGLMSGGMSMADAVRQIAEEDGKKENAVRGNYYNARRKLEGSNAAPARRGRRPSTTSSPEDAIVQARQLLEQALSGIDRELDEARMAVEEAQARYDQLASSLEDRKSDLERKIKALS